MSIDRAESALRQVRASLTAIRAGAIGDLLRRDALTHVDAALSALHSVRGDLTGISDPDTFEWFAPAEPAEPLRELETLGQLAAACWSPAPAAFALDTIVDPAPAAAETCDVEDCTVARDGICLLDEFPDIPIDLPPVFDPDATKEIHR